MAVIVLVDAAVLAAIATGAFRRERQFASNRRQPAAVTPPTSLLPSAGPTPSPTPVRACERPTLIGTVTAASVAARAKPDPEASVIASFDRENELGVKQVFDLVDKLEVGGRTWFKALLPIRPNGTTGFLPAKSLRVEVTDYRLRVDRDRFRLTLYNGCKKVRSFPVGIGTGSTPTPVGKFYLTGLFKPPDPTTVYGVSIYTLSGFSEVLTNWKMGGIIGLHGTNDPTSIGHNASHGCIMMQNADILRLEKILPLGTPIVIR